MLSSDISSPIPQRLVGALVDDFVLVIDFFKNHLDVFRNFAMGQKTMNYNFSGKTLVGLFLICVSRATSLANWNSIDLMALKSPREVSSPWSVG